MADGDPPDKIARELGMSKHTLRTHTQNVLTKLGVHSKLDAIVAAIRYGKVRHGRHHPGRASWTWPSSRTSEGERERRETEV